MDKTLVAHIKSSNSWWRKRWGQKMGSAQVAWAMWQGEQCHNWILNEGFFHLCPGNCIPTVELVGHELKYNGVPATVEEYIPLWAPSYNADERWKKNKGKKKGYGQGKLRREEGAENSCGDTNLVSILSLAYIWRHSERRVGAWVMRGREVLHEDKSLVW